jgi:threonine dehydratase
MSAVLDKQNQQAMPETITLKDIEEALCLVKKHLIRTPVVYSPEFSEASGNEVFFKLESLQRTHAFKARGALNQVAGLSKAERERGVIAASSGNHALGVAYASALLGINARVVMPLLAPATKIDLAKQYGAQVILHGETYDDALEHARQLGQEYDMALLPSFDDLKVIAGQGTIALEVLEALPDVDLFLAPIGGGGLVSGLAIALNEIKHPAELVGVEAEEAPSMLASLRAGERVKLAQIKTIADGIAVQQPGRLNFEFVRRYAPEVITVSDEHIFDGMVRMLWDMRVVVEPAAAAAPAALLFHEKLRKKGLKVCCIISGGNISQALLEQVIKGERG